MGLRQLSLKPSYRGIGIGTQVFLPCAQQAVSLDVISAYFSVGGLRAIAPGVDAIRERKGRMRVVMSIQDAEGSDFVVVLKNKEELRERVARVAKQIEADLAKIVDAMKFDQLATLGYMLDSGLLQVRVAAIADSGVLGSRGQLHQKAFVFKDEVGDGIAADGSTNFTENGFSWHSENLHVFKSWETPEHFAASESYFLAAWEGRDPELIVVDLDGDVLKTLSNALKRRQAPLPVTPVPLTPSERCKGGASALFEMMRVSPEFARFNTTVVPLYPHQERALIDAASRSHIRVMFCDDVGLGKTIEAGATLSHGIRHLGWKKVVILVPAGLARQWQTELREKIGLDSIRVDSVQKALVSYDESIIGPVDSAWPPGVYVMSAQLASRSPAYLDIFQRELAASDCLMLDEAHAARRRVLPSGDGDETMLFALVSRVAHVVPNLMLLTATPMQSQQEELVALLAMIGLPKDWQDRRFFAEYHDLFRRTQLGADAAILLERGVRATRRVYPRLPSFNAHGLVNDPIGFKQALVQACITPRLIIRNTREALGRIGYKFPRRIVDATSLAMSADAQGICDALDHYITNYFGQTEAVLFDRRNAIGYLTAIYFQRLVSSFHSASETLRKRSERLKSWLDADFIGIEVETPSDEEDDDPEARLLAPIDDNRRRLAGIKCRQELEVIEPILGSLARFAGPEAANDPKIKALASIVRGILAQKERFLIFSRYTDTTEALIQVLASEFAATGAGYGYYSGDECWICEGGRRVQATKHDIVGSLRSGRIDCVICTDAASEGLNLQSARHLINVDVPWNPARLEQRFGRIDRLGQVADEVRFYNLWYPGSIEERMYGAIHSRGQAIGFSVGVMSDTVGLAIRQHLVERTGPHNLDLERALDVVRSSQEQLNLDSIEYACGNVGGVDDQGKVFRSALLRLARCLPGASGLEDGIVSCGGRLYSEQLGSSHGETIALSSRCFEGLAFIGDAAEGGSPVHIVSMGSVPVCAAVQVEGGYRILSAAETAEATFAMRSGSVLEIKVSADVAAADASHAAIDAAIARRFIGRIRPDALVFDQVLTLPPRTITPRDYNIASTPCGFVRIASY